MSITNKSVLHFDHNVPRMMQSYLNPFLELTPLPGFYNGVIATKVTVKLPEYLAVGKLGFLYTPTSTDLYHVNARSPSLLY